MPAGMRPLGASPVPPCGDATRCNLHVVQHAEPGLKAARGAADGRPVIELNRIHGNGTFLVNADLIETIEARPDTIVTLVNKHRYVVEDSVEDVVTRIVAFRARVAAAAGAHHDHAAGARTLVAMHDEERAA